MMEVTRQQALKENLRFYFTNRPCSKGHLDKRYTHNSQCLGCQKGHSDSHRKTEKYAKTRRKRYERLYLEDPARFLHDRARGRSRSSGLEFSITVQDVRDVWPKDGKCPALQEVLVPNIGAEGKDGQSAPYSPSLDRLNPSQGYVRGNIAVISQLANSIKSYTQDAAQVFKVAQWMASQGLCGVEDARGNAEALLAMYEDMGLRIDL